MLTKNKSNCGQRMNVPCYAIIVFYLLYWHRFPVNSEEQEHVWKVFVTCTHAAPFWQGSRRHDLAGSNKEVAATWK